MKVHIVIDGFQAAVHQAITPELRHQPVAVAVDGSPQAVVFATSAEARRQRIWPGMRAEHARRRCPNLTVCLPDHERYRAAQEALLDVAYHWSPCVAGSGGRVDLDLDGTEHLWYDHFGTDDPLVQADTIAARCARVCQRRLRLPARVGSSHRLLLARLAARLARRRALDHLTLQPDTAWDELTPLPARWLPGLHDADLRLLADCHLDTIGGVRRLSQTQLTDILGQRGAAVWQILHDPQPEDESIPKRVEPEQTLGHTCDATTPTGFDPTAARAAVLDLVRDVGFQLRQHRLACQRLRLQARWIDGREHEQRLDLPVPSWHDDELLPIAQKLLSRLLDRRVHTMRLRLQACNLIAGYDQAVLFSPARQRQLEHVRDHLRLRFNATILCSGRQLQEQVTTEQATAEQATAEQATAEQATAERVP